MERQLALIETPEHDWRLDEHTKAVGRRGVEQAREALRRAHVEVMRSEQRSNAA